MREDVRAVRDALRLARFDGFGASPVPQTITSDVTVAAFEPGGRSGSLGMMRPCSIEGCEQPSRKRGWCPAHYWRWRENGDPLVIRRPGPKPIPAHERVLRRTDFSGDCWVWTGGVDRTGYGRLGQGSTIDGSRGFVGAHRAVYEALVGPIPDGHDLHHRCGVRRCVNPDHLEFLAHAEHTRVHGQPRDPATNRFTARSVT